MADRRGEGNIIKRAAASASDYEALVGVKNRADSLVNSVGKASSTTSNLMGKKIIDPLLGDAVQATYSQIVTKPLQKYRSLKPAFAREEQRSISYNKVAPAGRGAESGERPTRMFNIYTGNLEMGYENPNAQYAIFSHGWKGAEIEYTDIEKVRAKAVERDPYDPSKLRYQYLSEGITSDVQRLVAYYEREYEDLFQDGWKAEKTKAVVCGGVHVHERPCGNNQCEWDLSHSPKDKYYMQIVELTSEQRTVLEKRRSAYKIFHSMEATRKIVEHPENQKLGSEKLKAQYLWNDTCCINKTVTSEHITTLALMGEWYANAEFCVVQLDRHPRDEDWLIDFNNGGRKPFNPSDLKRNYESLQDIAEKSRTRMPYWSMRGWTLQECCLSQKMFFFNNRWEGLQYKPIKDIFKSNGLEQESIQESWPFPTPNDNAEDDYNTQNVIAEFTGIPTAEVCRGSKPSDLSAYDILAYAQQRQCTVEVDRVYSLMGMLHVKFAAFHAEGLTMALTRLLDSVVSTTHDVSIFNWAGEKCGSTIPGRSLYPVNFDPFASEISSTRARIYEGESAPGSKIISQPPEKPVPVEEYSLAEDQKSETSAEADIEREDAIAFQSLHDIDRHLEVYSHAVLNSIYEAIPEKSLKAVIDYVNDTDFRLLGKEGYNVVHGLFKVLREIDNRFQVRLAEDAAKAAEARRQKQLEEERLIKEAEQAAAAAAAPPTPPVEETAPIEPVKSSRSFGSSMRLKGTKGLFGSSKKSTTDPAEPVAAKPVRTSWLANAWNSASNTPAATPSETPNDDEESKKLGVEDWCALIERIVAFLRFHSKDINDLGGHQDATSRGIESLALRSKLAWISELLDAIAQGPNLKTAGLGPEDHQFHLNDAPYFKHMLAHRALTYIIGLQPSAEKPLHKPWELKKLLSFLQKTVPGDLSPAIIEKLNSVLYNTPYDQCPDMTSIESLVVATLSSHKGAERGHPKSQGSRKTSTHKPSMISRNPIIVSTSGIEGLFDIQRVVVDVEWIRPKPELDKLPPGANPKPDILQEPRKLVEKAIKDNKPDLVFVGECRISTGISSTNVGFSCTAQVLQKQLDLRAVLAQTELRLPDPEVSDRLDYVTILNFIREVDIELVAGEWVLARFAGVDRADWFLCLLEIGATHPFYGWRIPSSKVDFSMKGAEPDLVEWWEKYMAVKKTLWCDLIKKRVVKRKAESESKSAKAERKRNSEAVSIANLRLETLKALQGGESVVSVASDRITKYATGEILHVHGMIDRRMMEKEDYKDKKELRFRALEGAEVPVEAHSAVLSLDENSVLPTMFFAAKRIHMF
ncbi:hypothetical protein DFH27DRAFT_106803 [Peziza echinospora]|nr:hypothetical protein DFH27DRAFT_106803 [Peziza echinospora]